MITDLLWQIAYLILDPLVDALPEGELNIPALDTVFSLLGKVNSVIPIAGPMAAAVTALSLLAAFLVIRWVLVVWRQIPFT